MNLTDWINDQGFQFQKQNIRPWGTYELVVSLDGKTWAVMPRPFGYGFTEARAFEVILTDSLHDDTFRSHLIGWLGEDRVNQIKTIIETPETTQEVDSEIKLLEAPKDTVIVSEHIHNESDS